MLRNEDSRTKARPPELIVRLKRYLPLIVLLGLTVHLLLPQLTSLEHSLEVIRGMVWWAVALAILTQILSYLGNGFLLEATVALVGGEALSLRQATLVTTAASSIGLVAGGMVGVAASTYRWLRGSHVKAESAVLAGWLPIQLNNATVTGAAVFGLLHLLIVHQLTTVQAIGFSMVLFSLGLVVAGFLYGLHHRQQIIGFVVRMARRWAKLRRKPYDVTTMGMAAERFFDTWDSLGSGGWHKPTLGALLNVLFDMLTLYFVFLAAGHRVSPGVLLSGYGLPLLLGKITFLPGGLGIVEATMAALYNGLGVPPAVTVVVVLVYRFMTFWLPMLIGFLLVPHLNRAIGDVHGPSAD